MSYIVIIEARDGYRAFFSLAELMHQKDDPVMLVWEEEAGKPLPDNEKPFRLVSKSTDRSIFGIRTSGLWTASSWQIS